MKTTIRIFLTLSILFSLAAQTASAAFHLPEERERIRQSIKDASQTIRREKPDARENRATTAGDAMMKKDEMGQMMGEKREEFKKELETKRQAMKADMEKRREELKVRLQNIKDERKKQAVERIDQAIEKLNEQRTNHFTDVLDKLDQVLERVVSRADKAESRGLNVSAVRGDITNATTLITSAREAVKAQAEKAYALTITTEQKLKADVGKIRQALHADLTRVREAVKAAHDAIRKAATTLAQIPRVNEEPSTATPTQQQSPSQ